ncbi:MAG TPA: zinc-dependent peptidase [Chitinophagaceae bacterium]|nr:zinc-dependent peptidase [Chitinophagaceae bacterium]
MATLISKIINRFFWKSKASSGPLLPEEELLLQTVTEYSSLISRYIPYFNRLDEAGKKRFLCRVWHFKASKTFYFKAMEENAEIPILISAAAVQLTFGLRKYRLAFFKDIYIMPDAYQFETPGPLYIGHVSPKGIYISWKHFLQGYADETDNVNVAIHEMAHALAHDHFLDRNNIDHEFRTDFARLPAVFGPALAGILVNRRCWLRPYAYTNIQEFWAVAVEAFFENPKGLKDTMPRLYHVIGEILNQDSQTTDRKNTTI